MPERLKRVLIVDDEEDLTWTLSKKLSKDRAKFDVMCVNSGRQAIEVLNQVPFDLVVTDVRMPEVSGLELLQQVKRLYPDTRVIIMTAYGSADIRDQATQNGCFNYIEKPFEINELRRQILDALEERRGFHGNVSDFQLSDIIQLNCLGRLTSGLRVKCGNETGTIYFQEGNIVHAETDHLEGESAFYHIMSWQGGEFEVLRNQLPPKESITRGWQSLLLESMRRLDEDSELAREEEEREKARRQRQLRKIIDKICDASGVDHVLIHSTVGFPLAYAGALQQRPELISDLGNFLARLLASVNKHSRFLKGGEVDYWEMQLAKRLLMLCKIPDQDAYLSVIGKSDANSGFLRVEIKKYLKDLADLI
jgi:CheY-like chemotaxis protein